MPFRNVYWRPLVILLLLFAVKANAQQSYSFAGDPFTLAQAPYTQSDRVTGSFTVAGPLPLWLPETDLSAFLLDFSFSDGQQTRTSDNSIVCSFKLVTDGTGNIVKWEINLRKVPTPAPGDPQQTLGTTNFGDSGGIGPAGGAACESIALNPGGSSDTAGSWTRLISQPPQAVAVPGLSPAGNLLLAILLLGLSLRCLGRFGSGTKRRNTGAT